MDTLKLEVTDSASMALFWFPNMTSLPGEKPGLSDLAAFGPNKKEGRPRVEVFVIEGLTLAMVEKLSGQS